MAYIVEKILHEILTIQTIRPNSSSKYLQFLDSYIILVGWNLIPWKFLTSIYLRGTLQVLFILGCFSVFMQ